MVSIEADRFIMSAVGLQSVFFASDRAPGYARHALKADLRGLRRSFRDIVVVFVPIFMQLLVEAYQLFEKGITLRIGASDILQR